MTTFSELTLPALIFSVPAGHPRGDVPALGRLTVTDGSATDQWWVVWGCETNDRYTHTDSTGSGALFYEAEGRTAQGGAAVASLSGANASPAGSTTNNIVRLASLSTEYVSILSTQATGAGAHLTHVGSFRVFARFRLGVPAANLTVALEWGYGDFRSFTRNAEAAVPSTDAANWRLLDLGIVTIPALVGTQRWEGRVLAKSSASGGVLDVDCMFLVPIDIASGEASARARAATPTTFVAYDAFDQTAGALTGKTATTGGVWVGAGDADDFSVSGSGTVTRVAVSDAASTGRQCTLDVNTAGVYVRGDMYWTLSATTVSKQGVIARYVDSSNSVMAWVRYDGAGFYYLEVIKRIAGANSTLQTVALPNMVTSLASTSAVPLALQVDTGGRYTASVLSPAGVTMTVTGQDSVLATGGTLATGDVGIYGENTAAAATTLGFTILESAAYVSDAAIFASQSLEIRYDKAIREDSSGATWQDVSSYEGDFLRVPVTGREGRSVRFIVKASRNDPTTSSDPNIDDITATLAVTPRYLSVPAPS